ncbi:hypothetical protein QQA45_04730 [Sneathia sanguinegens]|uniref:Uncharacterized protein n=1 Tax=Sneathia sanguinegens TaxID=40543 RepID=A0ABT7HJW0_9FUSO|nr:hypothetical protein [Sneathia sanguinegens]MDK9580820.1 hypothetical protein [Sneathia sanguinegens]
MTYENFKYEVRKLGLNFYILNDLISVQDSERNALYSVDTTKQYIIYPTKRFSQLDNAMQEKLFYLIILLARTLIENRGDLLKETKWYLKHKCLNTWCERNYLRQDKGGTDLSLGCKVDDITMTSKFTKYDLDQLAKRMNIYDFIKEKVE